MRTADFDYELPEALIAQEPADSREASRMLVIHRANGSFHHQHFSQLSNWLKPGDLLVLNNSKVIPARLRAINPITGGRFELLLLEEMAPNDWWVMVKPGKRARVGGRLGLLDEEGQPSGITLEVMETNAEGHRRLRFAGTKNITGELARLGEMPLPPYIRRADRKALRRDEARYQTVYAEPSGSVAAPTAGLHFSTTVLETLQAGGIHLAFLTLHVGLGTFAPVKEDRVDRHVMHEERYEVGPDTARMIEATRERGGRVVAVGTTVARVLESVAARHHGVVKPEAGRTRIFIHPPYAFRVVDMMLTNFHLPRSTLLMLVSAFAAPGRVGGRDMILSAYGEAVKMRYRFFSYGDAMLLA